jgi:hypothetical protein
MRPGLIGRQHPMEIVCLDCGNASKHNAGGAAQGK